MLDNQKNEKINNSQDATEDGINDKLQLPEEAQKRRELQQEETIIPSYYMDANNINWIKILSNIDDEDSDNPVILLAYIFVLVGVASAATLVTTAKMVNAVYRTLRRSDNTSIDEVIACLKDLKQNSTTDDQKCVDLYHFVDAVKKTHHTGWFSSTRTSKDFDLRTEWHDSDTSEKAKSSNPTNLITYLTQQGTFAKHTNNGRRLFNETIFKGQGEVAIQKIRQMTLERQAVLIKAIAKKYQNNGCFSSNRSKQLFKNLTQEGNQTPKIASIVSFLRNTDKKQRMYQAIIEACADVASYTELTANPAYSIVNPRN